jgi:hypothetical protein
VFLVENVREKVRKFDMDHKLNIDSIYPFPITKIFFKIFLIRYLLSKEIKQPFTKARNYPDKQNSR